MSEWRPPASVTFEIAPDVTVAPSMGSPPLVAVTMPLRVGPEGAGGVTGGVLGELRSGCEGVDPLHPAATSASSNTAPLIAGKRNLNIEGMLCGNRVSFSPEATAVVNCHVLTQRPLDGHSPMLAALR